MNKCVYKWFWLILICHINVGMYAQKATKDTLNTELSFYNEALVHIDSARYQKAVPLLKKAIKLKPDYWEAYNKLAYIKIKQKEYKEAKKDLDKAESIAPLNYESLKLKGINYFHLNDFKQAKYYLDTAAFYENDDKLDDVELYYYRAQLMFKGKETKKALETCEAGLELNPRYIPILFLEGEIRFDRKEYNHAIKELSEAVKLMSETNKDYEVYKLRAKSRFEIGDYKGAVVDWNVYIDGIPDEEAAFVSRAAAKINYNDNSGAIIDLDEAIKLNPKNPVSYCYRGVAKGGNRQYVEALKDLDYSIKLKFDYSTAYVNRAAIKMASKDKRGACEDLGKADGLGNEMAVKLYDQYCRDTQR